MARVIKTRLAEGAPQVSTNVTVDFSGVSREELEELASKSVIITEQGNWRKNGEIPTGDFTISVREQLDRERAPRGPVDVSKLLAKMDPAERAALLAKFANED